MSNYDTFTMCTYNTYSLLKPASKVLLTYINYSPSGKAYRVESLLFCCLFTTTSNSSYICRTFFATG